MENRAIENKPTITGRAHTLLNETYHVLSRVNGVLEQIRGVHPVEAEDSKSAGHLSVEDLLAGAQTNLSRTNALISELEAVVGVETAKSEKLASPRRG